MVERDEFNEYGVKQSASKEKVKNSPNYSMIIIVTVLFSIFNFVVGYMIGKFLGNPNKVGYVSYVEKRGYDKDKGLDSIVGLPSSNYSSKENLTKHVDVSDLEESLDSPIVLENNDNVSSASKPYLQTKTVNTNTKSSIKQTSLSSKTSSSVSTKKVNSTSINNVSSTNKAYYVQVSANENKNIAQNTLEKLKSMGIKNASIINMSVGNKNVYKVRIGAFNSYEEASKTLEIARKVSKDAFIVVSPK